MKISKNELASFLDALLNEYQVYAPVKQGNYSVFRSLKSSSEANLSFVNAKLPSKDIIFPQSEKMISYQVTEQGAEVQEHLDKSKKVVFGIRPCDARSLLMLDKVFHNDQYRDPYYCDRRDNTILIGVGCNDPVSTCFCSSMGIGPFSTAGSDVFLVDIGDDYIVEAITDRGKALMAAAKLKPASRDDEEKAARVQESVKSDTAVNLEGLKERLDGMFTHAFWETLYEKCLGCNACTYMCPTCHCFDINEEAVDKCGSRVRCWDSCMASLFTLHGSGHNPRNSGKERWRQRVMHKFNYFVANNGDIACVGCGRCIKNCPVNLDIRKVIADIQAIQGDGEGDRR